MLDEVTIEIATGAAGNIIAYMLSGQIDALRTQVARMFRHGTPQERATVLHGLDRDVRALEAQEEPEANLIARWSSLLSSYLAEHPESRPDVESFASLHDVSKTIVIGSQNNYGSGAFIGGDNNGTVSLNGDA